MFDPNSELPDEDCICLDEMTEAKTAKQKSWRLAGPAANQAAVAGMMLLEEQFKRYASAAQK